jgi:hypothetical protein
LTPDKGKKPGLLVRGLLARAFHFQRYETTRRPKNPDEVAAADAKAVAYAKLAPRRRVVVRGNARVVAPEDEVRL